MSCSDCKTFQNAELTSLYRLDDANIEVRGCSEHLKKMFGRLNSFEDLFDACVRDEELATAAILATPTGEHRNKLTEINILRALAVSNAKEALK